MHSERPRRHPDHRAEAARRGVPEAPGDVEEHLRLHAAQREDGMRGIRLLHQRHPGWHDHAGRRQCALHPQWRSSGVWKRHGHVQLRVEHEHQLPARLVVH